MPNDIVQESRGSKGSERFTRGTGRRKAAIARVRLMPGSGQILVNDRPVDEYFVTHAQRLAARQALLVIGAEERYDVRVSLHGGGSQGQADAMRHGLARALVRAEPGVAGRMREVGFLTRDARVKERKKYGQRGARARFQFSKR